MITLNGKNIDLILAPMAEISDYPFREINKKYGADLTFTQMVSARGISNKHFDTLRYLIFNKKEKPIGVQLLIENEEYIEDSVSELVKLNPDVIDLNAGCPSNEICKKGLGAQLLNNPNKLRKILENIILYSKNIPVSLKLRIGFDRINIFEVFEYIKDFPLAFITIHARLKSEFYTGTPNYDVVKMVKQKYDKKIVFNGSCFCEDDYFKIKDLTNADAVMIARGALGNPFIFSKIKSCFERKKFVVDKYLILDIAKLHSKLILDTYGEINFAKYSRKYLIWYFMYFTNIFSLIDNIYKVDKYDDIINLINEFTNKNDINTDINEINKIKNMFYNKVLFWLQ